jgi:hypothetical protein
MSYYLCPRHDKEPPRKTSCPECMEFLKNAQAREKMTPNQRRDEINWWLGEGMDTASVDFALIHKRIHVLVGRPVFIHEFLFNMDGLIDEALDMEPHPSPDKMAQDFLAETEKRGIKAIILPKDNDSEK